MRTGLLATWHMAIEAVWLADPIDEALDTVSTLDKQKIMLVIVMLGHVLCLLQYRFFLCHWLIFNIQQTSVLMHFNKLTICWIFFYNMYYMCGGYILRLSFNIVTCLGFKYYCNFWLLSDYNMDWL